MEDNSNFLEEIKKLQDLEEVELNNPLGTILNIEQIEYETFKLMLEIEGNRYGGIYIEYNKNNELKKGDIITLYVINLIKKERNIYLYLNTYHKKKNVIKGNKIDDEEQIKIYDLSPSSLIDTLTKNTNIIYNSDIFIYKKKDKEHHFIPIFEEKQLIINGSSNMNEFQQFILKNKLKDESLIYIENYILNQDQDNISFNNFTIFNIVKLEYLDEYFKIKFKLNYKINGIFNYKINSNYKENFVLLKVIDLQDEYIIGIDYFSNIYKINKNIEKIKDIQDVYTIIFIKYYSSLIIQDSLFILTLKEDSYIYIFENSFSDLFINNLSVINFNSLDFIEKGKNFFNQIRFSEVYNDFSLEITKKSEYIILFSKFNLV